MDPYPREICTSKRGEKDTALFTYLQGGASGQGQPFVDIGIRVGFIARSLYCGGAFNLISTNSVPRPDGPPIDEERP